MTLRQTSPHRPRSSRALGMTLIEVLVAMAILGMMVFSLWSGFSATVRGIEVTEKVQNRYSGVRGALSRMTAELGMAYLSFNRPPDENRPYTLFVGKDNFNADIVTFSSFAHLRLRKDADESDQAAIQYFLAPAPDGAGKHLYRRETRRLTGELPEDFEQFVPSYILCENVESLELQYWDNKEEEWRDDWSTLSSADQADRIPERVLIRLGIREPDGELEVFSAQALVFMREKINLG